MNRPPAPVVAAFTASPSLVEAGGQIELAWRTTGAVEVTVTGGGETIVDGGSPDGSVTVRPTNDTVYSLVATASDGRQATATATVQVTVEVAPPRIMSFAASPATIDIGGTASLSWRVTDAISVVITGDDGSLAFEGSGAAETATVSPTRTTTYTLTVRNEGGEASATASVTVRPPLGARIDAFAANPTTVWLGRSADLVWVVDNAERIEVSASGSLLTTSTELSGSLTVQPNQTTSYTLTAFHPAGDATAMATVTVDTNAPTITAFDASPNPLVQGGLTTLSWSTLGADRVRVMRGTIVEADSTMPDGSVSVRVVEALVTFTLEASNAAGTNTTRIFAYGHATPTIEAFSAGPGRFVPPGPATVSWDVRSVQTLALFADGAPVAGFPSVNSSTATDDRAGSMLVPVVATTTFRLVATSLAGSVESTATVVAEAVEQEPNGTPATATPVATLGVPVFGEVSGSGDEDYYAITVPQGGFIHAFTDDGAGGCASDTILTLVAPSGAAVLASDDDGGAGLCSLIDAVQESAARDLAAGTYFLVVSGRAPFGSYALTAQSAGPACGNGIPEAGEQCDDGNTATGDGCDAQCATEAVGAYAAPGAPAIFTDAISVVGEHDFYRVEVSADAYLSVQTIEDAVTGTCPFDTVIRLFASDRTTELAFDDDHGVNACSHLDLGEGLASLAPGTYWLRVEEQGDDQTISTYQIVFESVPALVCGNGVTEGTEECDDGNPVATDGCNSSCVFTGLSENEAAGNNFTFSGGVVTATSSTVLRGALGPAGDVDWWAVTVPAGYSVDASLTVNGFMGCPVSPEGRIGLYDTNSATPLATDDSDGPGGNCGRVYPGNDLDTGNLEGGTYFLQIREDSQPRQFMTYYVHLTISPPTCGNGLHEQLEQCDDGNFAAGDGCSPTCGFEPIATYSAPGPVLRTYERIDPVRDVDAVQITVTSPSYLFAETFTSTLGLCIADTRLRLYASDGLTELGTDDEDGVDYCSAIDAQTDPWASVTPGTYWITVEEDGLDDTIASYFIDVQGTPVGQCGNRVREGSETCDDGNTSGGDGCDAVCQIEPDGVFVAPGPPVTFVNGSISPVGDRDLYRVDVASTAYLLVDTFTDAQAMSCLDDHFLRLFDAQFNELGVDDDDGRFRRCSSIGVQDAFARLSPGSYFISMEETGGNQAIGRYDIVFDSITADVCGNGVPELAIGERCDDGNTVDGDGCSSACQLTGPVTSEVEPNRNQATATPSGLTTFGTQVVTGVLSLNDSDWWSFTVPTGGGALTVVTYEIAGDPSSCPTIDNAIYLHSPMGVERVSNSGTAVSSCASLSPPFDPAVRFLQAGTYYIRTEHYLPSAQTTPYTYYMYISVQ